MISNESVAEFRSSNFRFTGTAGEYFRIWIVNLCLSIVTLGIYSAWAKVRSKRYFCGNTWLDETAFEYHASPIAILKGRLIAAAVFAAYMLLRELSPVAGMVAGIAFVCALPWIIVRSLTFNARNSSYRNVRFDFRGSLSEAVGAFVFGPALTMLTLGIAYPWLVRQQMRFVMANHAFGMTQARFEAANASFYSIYLRALGLLLLISVLAAVGGGVLLPQLAYKPFFGDARAMLVLTPVLFYGAYLCVYGFIRARLTNLVWGSVAIGTNAFESRLEARRLAWIYLTNALGILLSVGLLIPWAAVRTARYRLERLTLLSAEEIEVFMTDTKAKTTSTGEELAERFDADVGL